MSLKQVLEPQERMAELLFGLIMVLTCTGSPGIVTAGGAQVRTMLSGAIGNNLAWGIIDAIFFLIDSPAGRCSISSRDVCRMPKRRSTLPEAPAPPLVTAISS